MTRYGIDAAAYRTALTLLPVPDEQRPWLSTWLVAAPLPTEESADATFEALADPAGERLVLRWVHDHEHHLGEQAVLELFEQIGAGPDLLGEVSAGAALGDGIGAWLEVRPDGIDLGWVATGTWASVELETTLVGPAGAGWSRWAETLGATTTSVGRTVADERFWFVDGTLPACPLDRALDAVDGLAAAIGVAPPSERFGAELGELIRQGDLSDGDVVWEWTAWWSAEGGIRAALTTPPLDVRARLFLAGATGHESFDWLARVEATFGEPSAVPVRIGVSDGGPVAEMVYRL